MTRINGHLKLSLAGLLSTSLSARVCTAHLVGFYLLTMCLVLPTFGQNTTARLTGTVVGPSGAALPGVAVKTTNIDTGYTQSAISSGTGRYLFPALPIGTYQITATSPGFAPYTQKGIVLSVGQAATVDVAMTLATVSQQVTVHSNVSMVTTDSPQVSDVVNQRSIVKLPLNGREVQQLVFLQPGVTDVTSSGSNPQANYSTFGAEVGTLPGEQYAKVNGSPAAGVSYQMDGVDYNDIFTNTNYPFPNPDAIQEFNLVTGNMSALYGNATGAVVNIVTKSGTNAIHGDLFEFIRNAALDSRNWFATSVAPLKQNQFGGSAGGPILKNRLFYFGSYQGTRIRTTNPGKIAFVPTAAERAGDFSSLLPTTQLINPFTGVAYLNNQVPVNPVSKYFMDRIPLPNGPNGELTFTSLPVRENTNEYMGKVDLNAGKHHVSGRYFQLIFNTPPLLPSPSNILQTSTGVLAVNQDVKSASVVDIYSISPRFLLNSYFGWIKEDEIDYGNAPFGMADAGSNIAQPKAPMLALSVSGGFRVKSQSITTQTKTNISVREVLSWILGSDQLQLGGEIAHVHMPMGNTFQEGGVFSFNALTGNSMADFVTGAVSNFAQGGGLWMDFSGYRPSLFLQNNWQATPRLTVDAGIRWDPFFPYTDTLGRVACFVPGAQSVRFPNAPVGMLFGGKNHDAGCPDSSIYNNPKNFAPRLGFAYRLTNDGKTSVRGGVGYYYSPAQLVDFEDVVGIPPFAPIVGLTKVTLDDPYGSAGIANPFPANFGPINPGPESTFPSDISFTQIFDRHFRLPMTLAYNLTVERAIGSSWMARASYVGNTSTHLSGTADQEAGLLQLNPPDNPPYPDYGSIASINSGVNANYNGLQVILQKRFSYGLMVQTNFTWQKAMDDFGLYAPGNFAGTNTCICGRGFDYGTSPDNVAKVYKLNAVYQTPNLRVPALAGKLLDGWEVSGIVNWQTGQPLTMFSGVDNSGSGIGADRADLLVSNPQQAVLGTGRSHQAQANEWFKTAAFGVNQPGTYGNTGKSILAGPRDFNTDFAAMKTTKVTEGLSLEFRAEFYNIFNNVNFGLPDTEVTDGSSFGQITSAADPRIMQFGLKMLF